MVCLQKIVYDNFIFGTYTLLKRVLKLSPRANKETHGLFLNFMSN